MPPIGVVIRLFGSLCAVFILSQFYRSAIAVIAPGLRAEADLSAEMLGLLTGAFFIAIAAMQLPVGVMLDRYGGQVHRVTWAADCAPWNRVART